MAKPRIPLPKQVEKVHRTETDYDRRREKRLHQQMDVFGMWKQLSVYFQEFLAEKKLSSTQFNELKSLTSLETFVMTDQPETCRSCGARTNFRQVTDTKQFHQCTACGESYWLVKEADHEL